MSMPRAKREPQRAFGGEAIIAPDRDAFLATTPMPTDSGPDAVRTYVTTRLRSISGEVCQIPHQAPQARQVSPGIPTVTSGAVNTHSQWCSHRSSWGFQVTLIRCHAVNTHSRRVSHHSGM